MRRKNRFADELRRRQKIVDQPNSWTKGGPGRGGGEGAGISKKEKKNHIFIYIYNIYDDIF